MTESWERATISGKTHEELAKAINQEAYEATKETIDQRHFMVAQRVTIERVRDLLTTAFESTQWASTLTGCMASGEAANIWNAQSKKEGYRTYSYLPCMMGGYVTVRDAYDEGRPIMTLDALAVATGLTLMAQDYPEQWANFIAENEDADTGDVFLQCCLFGEVIYA